MDLELTFAHGDGYLLATAKGTWTAAGVAKAINDAADEAHRRGSTRVLLDATRLSAPPESDYHRFIAGEQLARAFQDIRLAVVSQGDTINRFAEEVAFAQGADVRVVPDYEAGLRWLAAAEGDETAGAARS